MDKRSGLIVSAAAHAVLAGLALFVFSAPRPFEAAAERSIMVDVMTPQEAAQEQAVREQAANEQAARKAQQSLRSAESKTNSAQTPPQRQPTSSQSQPSQQEAPQETRTEAAQPPPDTPAEGLPSIDAGELLPVYNLRLPTDIDARKAVSASLSREDIAGMKAHLRKCWRLPAGVAAGSGTRVVMRVPFSPTGGLAGEPTLVEASAAQDGPAVVQAALAALAACAPYGFLPRDRYKEWRVLDITFTPRDMGGG